MSKTDYVYMITNKPNGVLYIGVISDLVKRMFQHRQKEIEGFSKKYNLTRLVWYEVHNDINEAIIKEKRMKEWQRDWKIKRIEQINPDWKDLWSHINKI